MLHGVILGGGGGGGGGEGAEETQHPSCIIKLLNMIRIQIYVPEGDRES